MLALSSSARLPRQLQAAPACTSQALPLDQTLQAAWDGTCPSESFAGHFARFHTITVKATQVVSIYLKSAIDPVLVLHDGDSAQGTLLATGETGSGAGTDAEIVTVLPAGTYTIEATTRLPGVTGDFSLVARRNTAPCVNKIKPGATVSGMWTPECAGEFRDNHYAKFYTVTVPTRQTLSLSLRTPTALYPSIQLRAGPTQLGPVIRSADSDYDSNDVAGFNQVVEPGTYTVEVASSSPLTLGSFRLSVSRLDQCLQTTALDVEVSGELTGKCSATFRSGRFAKFYTFSVPSDQVVTISYTSEADGYAPYLGLRLGSGALGPELDYQGNNFGRYGSVLQTFLTAGTYTLEASSYEEDRTGAFTLAARTNSPPCFGALPVNAVVGDSWDTACPAAALQSRYAKYKRLTVTEAARYTFNLRASVPPALLLHAGSSQLGPVIQRSAVGGSNSARITALLQPGDYLLEATTYNELALGDFEINTQTSTSDCNAAVRLDTESSGIWTQRCLSSSFADRYARFYTVEVTEPQIVTAMLSAAQDAYLVLHDGADAAGVRLAEDDNAGIGLNASIARLLMPGRYTYEATTSEPGKLGDFTLAVRTNSAPCFAAASLGQTASGTWTESCLSTTMNERYARFHAFTVPESRVVTLQLTSATDAYLVLRAGPNAQLGTVVARDDNSGGGTDARISMTLPPGNYTVEATTGKPRQLGTYTLRLD